MSSDYLSSLANQLSSQFVSTANNALNILQDGHNRSGGSLGDYSQKIDQTNGRKYLEEGYLRLDPYNVLPKAFELLLQEPDITILVKKRAFSTLADNHRPDFMDAEEKLFYKATKMLFQNKCNQIAALEKLSKIDRISQAAGQIDDQLLPVIMSLVDQVTPGFSSPVSGEASFLDSQASEPFKKLTSVIAQIRKVYAFSDANKYTTWITDPTALFQTDLSQGTGVLEITNMASISTTTSLGLAAGNFSFQIVDPYKAMVISNSDIEWALMDATNAFNNNVLFQLGKASSDRLAAENMKALNDTRVARGAGPIDFIIDANAPAGLQVSAIIENIGEAINFTYNQSVGLSSIIAGGGVSISPESLKGGAFVQQNGLDPTTEVSLFTAAIIAIYNSIQLKQSAQTTVSLNPLLTNYARGKLRLHYGNKTIIQAMDQVHVYLGTKSRTDNKVITGLQNMFSGVGTMQNLNSSNFDLKNQFNTLFNPSANIDLQLEKSVFVGSNFPTALWVMMRNMFVNEKNGCHVFGGVVESAQRQWSDGKWTVSITGKDNAAFLDYGIVILKPGIDNFNGALYDPLTPFKTQFNLVSSNFNNSHPQLLTENQEILSQQTSTKGLMRFKSGRNAGQPITLNNYFEDKELSGNGSSKDIYYSPDGLVYKWKEGIGVLVGFGDSFNADNLQTAATPSITANQFAGQDVMNVISLYITGLPYNFATYYKAVTKFGQLNRNPQSGAGSAGSLYTQLTNSLKQNNLLWGDFIPFKNLVVDEQTFIKTLDSQASITNANDQINTILAQIQDTTNKLYILQKGGDSTSPTSTLLQNDLRVLNQQLGTQQSFIATTMSQSTTPLSLVGNDVSYDPDQLQDSQSFSLSDPNTRRELRRRVNFLTRRLSWQVRANEDNNLFIVDDSYDKDYDITAFEETLAGELQQYNSEYSKVKDKVESVAQLLNLEVFCDSQGHIRARPQQYNRMPSSIFYRMLQLKQQTGIQVFPQFIEDLFSNNIKAAIGNIKVVEDQIRLDGAVLGLASDGDVANFINNPQFGAKSNFQFISDDSSGPITDVSSILDQNNPDTNTNQNTTFIDKLNAQNSNTSIFSTTQRALIVQSSLSTNLASNTVPTTTLTLDRINTLKSRILAESGQPVQLDNFQQTPINSVLAAPVNSVDIYKLTNDLAQKISARQKLIKQAAGIVKNAQEVQSLDDSSSNTGNNLLFSNLYGNQNVPEIFQSMIEDETFDDYGPGSGGRYIIHNYQIINFTITETAPEFTTIEVSGLFDPLLGKDTLPSEAANAFQGGGNKLTTAAAIDYDLWRMYGYKTHPNIQVPFFSNPQSQCAPYAASLLSRARKNIIQASLTIAGNEYMQAGEVVYIEDDDLLFYVESVSHSFSQGGSFTTTLRLTYGHNAGEYIPTALDVIGKMLYNITAPSGSSAVNYRQSSVFNENPMGAIIVNQSSIGSNGLTDGNNGDFNSKIINNILNSAAGIVNQNNIPGNNVIPMLELRIFYDKSAGGVDSNLSSQVSNLQSILTGSATINPTSTNTTTPPPTIPAASITPVQVDISSKNEHRSPSQQAWDLARNAANNTNSGPGIITDAQATQQSMFSNIIDCVMTFSNSNNSTSTTNSTSGSS